MYIVATIAVLAFVGYVITTGYEVFHPEPQRNITFNVVGIVNATNSSLVQIQFECIKFCGKDLDYVNNDKVKLCWEQCSELGK